MEDSALVKGEASNISPRCARCVFIVALCMSLFHLYTAGIGLLQQPVQRAIHVGFTLVLVYMLFPVRHKILRPLDFVLVVLSLVCTGYVVVFNKDIAMRGGSILQHEVVLGLIAIGLVLEGGRRVLGKALPILASIFLLYCYFGSYAPGFLAIRGYSIDRIVQHMYLSSEGIFGVAVGVSSTYIFMFILFGAFLVNGGGAQLFNNLAMTLAGHLSGGPAKVAVIASGLMGTINGSSIANAATVGTMTIPMMKKVGYSAEEAAGIEACSSTGGQLMPPIMGAGAFIMAEFLNLPYLTIALAALLPAVLYYASIFVHVHYIAKRDNISGLETGMRVWQILKSDGYLLLPIILIIIMLVMHYTPLMAAFWAILAISLISFVNNRNRMTPAKLAITLADGAKGAIGTAMACAVVGFVVGTSSLTALGLNLSGNIIDLTNGNLFLTLLLSMFACLVIGMGLPTTANYIVTSAIIVPALSKMGVPGLAAHMFVFYFGIKADITPPVCLATYTAAGIAKADPTKAAITAISIAIPSFILPYLFVYAPDVMLQESILGGLYTGAMALVGIFALTGAILGWFSRKVGASTRLLLLVAGLCCFMPWHTARLAGLALTVGLYMATRNTNKAEKGSSHAV